MLEQKPTLLPNQRHNTQHGQKGEGGAKVKGRGRAYCLLVFGLDT